MSFKVGPCPSCFSTATFDHAGFLVVYFSSWLCAPSGLGLSPSPGPPNIRCADAEQNSGSEFRFKMF